MLAFFSRPKKIAPDIVSLAALAQTGKHSFSPEIITGVAKPTLSPPNSDTSNESDSRRSSDSGNIPKAPEKLPEAEALIKMNDYFFFLDAIDATNVEDESCYQHNKAVIKRMITSSEKVVFLPDKENKKAVKEYIAKMKRYDFHMNGIMQTFSLAEKDSVQMYPSIYGKKSLLLADLYQKYLSSHVAIDISEQSLHPSLANRKKQNKKTHGKILDNLQRGLNRVSTIQVGIEAELIKKNMHTSVALRKERLQHLALIKSEKKESTENEDTAALEKAMRQYRKAQKEFTQQVTDNPQQYPAKTQKEKESFIEDFIFSQTSDAYALCVNYPDKEMVKILKNKILQEEKRLEKKLRNSMRQMFFTIDQEFIDECSDDASTITRSSDNDYNDDEERSVDENSDGESTVTKSSDGARTEESFDEDKSDASGNNHSNDDDNESIGTNTSEQENSDKNSYASSRSSSFTC